MAHLMDCRIVAVVLLAAAVASPCHAARHLRAHIWGDLGHEATNNARAFMPGSSSSNKAALTPEAAESGANSAFAGFYRNMAHSSRMSFATVEADPVTNNPTRKKQSIKTRARSAIDVPGAPNLSSGAGQFSALVSGGGSYAATYEGATAAATSDSLMVNQGGRGGKRKTVVANSMLTASTGSNKPASTAGSYAVTSGPVGSFANSGAGNGRIQLAQADTAVALAMTEKTSSVGSRTSWQN